MKIAITVGIVAVLVFILVLLSSGSSFSYGSGTYLGSEFDQVKYELELIELDENYETASVSIIIMGEELYLGNYNIGDTLVLDFSSGMIEEVMIEGGEFSFVEIK